MPHLYGPVPDGPTHGKIGVIVATEQRGPLANLVYCPPDQPLFKVPRYLYDQVPDGGRSSLQYKQPLAIGDQVEFALDENGHNTVLWMMKSPSYLPIDCRSGGSLRMEVIAAVTTFDDDPNGLGLWNPLYKYIQATHGRLRSRPLGVPLWCCIEIVISYGEYEGAPSVPLHRGFRPCYWFRLVDYLNKPVDPIEAVELLKKAPHLTAMLEINAGGQKGGVDFSKLETIFDRTAITGAARNPYESLETIFDRASKVRKRNKEEFHTEADELKGSNTKLRLQLAEVEKERDNAKEETVKSENECAALKQSIKQVTAMAEERDELKVSNSKLLVQLAEVEKEHENAKGRVTELENECAALKQSIEQVTAMAKERDELKASNSKLLVQLAEVEKEHENASEKVTELENPFKQSNKRVAAMAKERDELKGSNVKLRLQLAAVEKGRDNAREEIVKSEKECAALKLSNEKFLAQFGCLKNQQGEASETRRENAQLRERLTALEKKLSVEQRTSSKLVKELSVEKKTSSKLRQDLARAQKEGDHAKTTASHLGHKLNRYGEVVGQNVKLRNIVETGRKNESHLNKQLAKRSKEDSVCAVANSAAYASKFGTKFKKSGKSHWI